MPHCVRRGRVNCYNYLISEVQILFRIELYIRFGATRTELIVSVQRLLELWTTDIEIVDLLTCFDRLILNL